ncbi:hypothetical protein Ae201684P_010987 [Aphanomyces euteiches]|uniref:U4/U6.U5 small nuclear ribonucleoprotein 27kDa protein domain-containing protein n=1 Tax=Aphanomyces euteiches TaxID=100861 RepID=A0A6G0XYH7_9STRA|nr:hypothetical protein Ae201684_000106 [Aphanomyces euteiches]KAH9091442.1 hypothetical protein Ae201684P_010987 [Aphanomyces euteiches]KAH9146283.1 hypothetical protein AeRB84_009870 [Aphanomyces euteiches]
MIVTETESDIDRAIEEELGQERRPRRSPSPPRRRVQRSPSPKPAVEVLSMQDFRERILQGDEKHSDSKESDKSSDNKAAPEPEISEEEQMRALLGFAGFDTTKGKEVEDNLRGPALGASNVKSKREYRQFMNKRSNFMKPKPPPQMLG